MNVINQIKAWYNKVVADAKKKRSEMEARALEAESRRVIQAMEFDSELYLCYKGIPIINEDQLMSSLPDTIELVREIYANYVMHKDK